MSSINPVVQTMIKTSLKEIWIPVKTILLRAVPLFRYSCDLLRLVLIPINKHTDFFPLLAEMNG